VVTQTGPPRIDVMLDRSIAVAYDVFRSPALGLWRAEINATWLAAMLRPGIARAGGRLTMLSGEGEDAAIPVRAAVAAGRLTADAAGWAAAFSGGLALQDVWAPLRTYRAVVGFELSPAMLLDLDAAGIAVFDVAIDPLRFADDAFLQVRTNRPDLAERLASVEETIEEIDNAVGLRLAAQHRALAESPLAVHPRFAGPAALFVGQTLIDRALIQGGRLVGLEDHLDAAVGALRGFATVLLKPHPYAAESPAIRLLRDYLPGAVVISDNLYTLLGDARITTVVGLSSSALAEARYFGKTTIALLRPDVESGPSLPSLSRWYRLRAGALNCSFWAACFSGSKAPLRKGTPVPGVLRRAIGMPYAWTEYFVPPQDRRLGPGDHLRLQAGQQAERFLVDGWHSPEDWGVWSRGRGADLLLDLEATGPLRLTLSLYGSPALPGRSQRVGLSLRGGWETDILAVELPPAAITKVELVLRRRPGAPPLTALCFTEAGGVSAAAAGVEMDSRVIGFGLIDLRLAPIG
jgi:hypothetical protein